MPSSSPPPSSVSAADFPVPPSTSHNHNYNYNYNYNSYDEPHHHHHHHQHHSDTEPDTMEGPVRPVVDHILLYSRLLLSDTDKAPLFYFTIVSVLFTVVELVTALLASSLALGFSGLHSAFVAFGFAIALSTSVISSRPAPRYSFGYQRVTVLLRFANATYLVFVCFSVITEGIQHSLGHVHAHRYPNLIMLCAVISGILKLIGFLLFKRRHLYTSNSRKSTSTMSSSYSYSYSSSSSSSSSSAATTTAPSPADIPSSPSSLPMPSTTPSPHPLHALSAAVAPLLSGKGPWRVRTSRTMSRIIRLTTECLPREAVSDCVPSVCVMLSVVMGRWVEAANLYLAVVAAGLVGYLCIEELSSSAFILLQTTPENVQSALETCLLQASTVDGVLECHNMHWWTLREGVVIGSLAVRVRSEADEQSVLIQVHRHFAPVVSQLTVQIEKDDWHASPMEGRGDGESEGEESHRRATGTGTGSTVDVDGEGDNLPSTATDGQHYPRQYYSATGSDGVSLRREKMNSTEENKNASSSEDTPLDASHSVKNL